MKPISRLLSLGIGLTGIYSALVLHDQQTATYLLALAIWCEPAEGN